MNEKNAGGPAFPVTFQHDDSASGCTSEQEGMTLLDYFAAKAMAAMIINEIDCTLEALAERSYHVAYEMLKARKS